MIKIIKLLLFAALLSSTTIFAQSADEPASGEEGAFLGAADIRHPGWFKESFLDFSEDIAEAAANGKRLVLYFWQQGCPYCNRLWEHNMADEELVKAFRAGFDVVAVNMWGDEEVITVGGRQFTEKQLARALDVDFTPTLIFYDEQKKVVLRLNGYLPPERFKLALSYASGKDEAASGLSFSEYVAAKSAPKSGLARSEDFFKAAEQVLYDRTSKPADRPLAVIFETADCPACERFHDITLRHEDTRGLLAQMDVVQLDVASTEAITLPDGSASTPARWARDLNLSYFPSIAFFDENGKRVMLMETYFRNFHTQSIFAYVLEKGYLQEPSFQRYITARSEQLRKQGVDVDIWEE